jgi:hypothetical protein
MVLKNENEKNNEKSEKSTKAPSNDVDVVPVFRCCCMRCQAAWGLLYRKKIVHLQCGTTGMVYFFSQCEKVIRVAGRKTLAHRERSRGNTNGLSHSMPRKESCSLGNTEEKNGEKTLSGQIA